MRIVSCPPSDGGGGGGGGGGGRVLSSAGMAQASTAEASTRSRFIARGDASRTHPPVHSRPAASSRGSARLPPGERDRKSTRLNSSHTVISYAVFCLKKKKDIPRINLPRCTEAQ